MAEYKGPMTVYMGDDGNNNIGAHTGMGDFEGHDKLIGGGGDDILRGGASADVISGGQGNDTISGGQGDDYIYGGKGNDLINGAKGDDTADYEGTRSQYTVTVDRLGRLHITDTVANRSGSDILQNIEHVHFKDGNVTYDVVNNQLVEHHAAPSNPEIISA